MYTNQKGVGRKLGELEGTDRWTKSSEDCLNIEDTEGLYTHEEGIAIDSGNGAETEVNKEKEDDIMDVQVRARGHLVARTMGL